MKGSISLLVYALVYFCAKCLVKMIFLLIPIWNIVVMRKKEKSLKSMKIDRIQNGRHVFKILSIPQ